MRAALSVVCVGAVTLSRQYRAEVAVATTRSVTAAVLPVTLSKSVHGPSAEAEDWREKSFVFHSARSPPAAECRTIHRLMLSEAPRSSCSQASPLLTNPHHFVVREPSTALGAPSAVAQVPLAVAVFSPAA